ncbi:hypothetical protein NE237_017793 [Protea cynaroides]|uniref:Uncharacterized protein n=1 Tax=Protea cynaroides TaxID=273540 RepID=A0A9Q0K8N8_9MAGN|nr:hypothetical protein NE237_017793 [Protea cynaroides]
MSTQFPGSDRMPELHQSHLSSSSEFGKDDHIPTAQPWPESKPINKLSPSKAKEEDHEYHDIDAQLKVVLESFRELLRESEGLFKKVFSKLQHDHLSKKQTKEGQADPKRKASLELGKKKIARILKQDELNQMKAGMFQRSLSLDSPRTPLGRFKIKPLQLGGSGGGKGGSPDDVKGSTKNG